MVKKERIVRYSAEELQAMRRRGESKSDWARAAAMLEGEVEAAVAADPEEARGKSGNCSDREQRSPMNSIHRNRGARP